MSEPILPPGHWVRGTDIEFPPDSGNAACTTWVHAFTELRVLRSKSKVRDGGTWWHVSVSRSDRMPTWSEVMKVRNEFLGPEVEAYQVLPRHQDHVNIHNYCLHLWAPVDGQRRVANLQDLVLEEAI
jgi:hypothetical protein